MSVVKSIANHILKQISSFSLFLNKLHNRIAPATDLAMAVQMHERCPQYRIDCSKQLAKILKSKLVILDVGARGGILEPFDRYAGFVDPILVEPEPTEATQLRQAGFRVVESALAAGKGSAVLHVLRQPGASSLLSPTGGFMPLYANDTDRYDVMKTIEVKTDSIGNALRDIVGHLDFLKLDTQGTELDILRGLGDYKPLFIQSEVSMIPIYDGQCMMWDVMRHVWDAGYAPFNFYISFITPGPRAKYRPTVAASYRGLPAGGDVLLMPDWTRPEGRALIKGREREFAALCLIFGMENILRFVLAEADWPERDAIRAAL